MVTLDPILEDVKFADLVVVGRIKNYHVVWDAKVSEEREAVLDGLPEGSTAEMGENLESQTPFVRSYARFDILVDEVLRGTASDTVSATWYSWKFEEPSFLEGEPFLIALIARGSMQAPLYGQITTVMPPPDDVSMIVLQALCNDAFVIPEASAEVQDIRAILAQE
jgi:hypothetical protein